MKTDLTFITNEPNRKLLNRFQSLIKDTRFFDVLVGYFFTSGFYTIYKSLEKTEKIRILIGIGTGKSTVELIDQAKQSSLPFSHAEAKEAFSEAVTQELANSDDKRETEEGVHKFLEWLRTGKL
ncbi:MAG TPA: helicase, partial [candidate division Zixibacteria bacterium]|nr:helicase [candidate division Zixibacteria bacterium]